MAKIKIHSVSTGEFLREVHCPDGEEDAQLLSEDEEYSIIEAFGNFNPHGPVKPDVENG
jgi:hypothetical protein